MRSLKIDRPLNSLSVARGTKGEGGTRDYDHLGFNPLHQTEVSKVIGVQSPWAIAQAVSDNRVKARGPGHPQVNLPAQQPFRFNT